MARGIDYLTANAVRRRRLARAAIQRRWFSARILSALSRLPLVFPVAGAGALPQPAPRQHAQGGIWLLIRRSAWSSAWRQRRGSRDVWVGLWRWAAEPRRARRPQRGASPMPASERWSASAWRAGSTPALRPGALIVPSAVIAGGVASSDRSRDCRGCSAGQHRMPCWMPRRSWRAWRQSAASATGHLPRRSIWKAARWRASPVSAACRSPCCERSAIRRNGFCRRRHWPHLTRMASSERGALSPRWWRDQDNCPHCSCWQRDATAARRSLVARVRQITRARA